MYNDGAFFSHILSDILMYNYDQYTLNNELSEFMRGLRSQGEDSAPPRLERTDDEREEIVGNMTMSTSINESQVKQNGSVRTGEATTTMSGTNEVRFR